MPRLLELLDVIGAEVKFDATHCLKDTAEPVRRAGADYLLAVKGNQKSLHENIKLLIDVAIQHGDEALLHAVDEPDNSPPEVRPTGRAAGVDHLRGRRRGVA